MSATITSSTFDSIPYFISLYYFRLWVFVCGYDAIKEALAQGTDFAGRPVHIYGYFDETDTNQYWDGELITLYKFY